MIKVEFVPTDGGRGFLAELILLDKKAGRLVIDPGELFDNDESEWEFSNGAWYDVNDGSYGCRVYVAKHADYAYDPEIKGA